MNSSPNWQWYSRQTAVAVNRRIVLPLTFWCRLPFCQNPTPLLICKHCTTKTWMITSLTQWPPWPHRTLHFPKQLLTRHLGTPLTTIITITAHIRLTMLNRWMKWPIFKTWVHFYFIFSLNYQFTHIFCYNEKTIYTIFFFVHFTGQWLSLLIYAN